MIELSQNGDIEIKNKNLIVNVPEEELSITMDIQNKDGIQYLSEIDDSSVDLVLTDPPYITSSETGMGNLHKDIQKNQKEGIKFVKTEKEWDAVKEKYIGKIFCPPSKAGVKCLVFYTKLPKYR